MKCHIETIEIEGKDRITRVTYRYTCAEGFDEDKFEVPDIVLDLSITTIVENYNEIMRLKKVIERNLREANTVEDVYSYLAHNTDFEYYIEVERW